MQQSSGLGKLRQFNRRRHFQGFDSGPW